MKKRRSVKVLPEILALIGAAADRYGLHVYAVGGYVRDKIMGLVTKDIDILVNLFFNFFQIVLRCF